jgi:succinate-acetate transporter protein
MARGYEDDFTSGLANGVLLLAVLIAAGIGMLLWVMLTELWKIYATRAFTGTRSAKVLWAALAALCVVYAIAGIIALNPELVPVGVFLACWATFAYVVTCCWIEAKERRKEVPVMMPKALPDVVSWKKPIEKERSMIA